MPFQYCPLCATKLTQAERGGRMRSVCPNCDFVHYRNPTVGVAVVVLQDGKLLLGRRGAGHSYAGQWCIPCGHVEWDEDVRVAAAREFAEETGLTVALDEQVVAVHSNFHNAAQHTVGIWFRGRVLSGMLQAGDDLDQVDYFALDAPPQPLAFPTDLLVIEQLQREQLQREQDDNHRTLRSQSD